MKTVIEMALEAGISIRGHYDETGSTPQELLRFAALVEDDFKERLAKAIEQMPFGDTAASFAVFVRNFK